MTLKRLVLAAVILLALGVGGWIALGPGKRAQEGVASPSSPAAEASGASVGSGQNGPTAFDNALGLALQGVSLFQGSKGAELWRLKATWAHLSQDGDIINVDMPKVRYLLGAPGSEDFLDVVSQKGKVTDHQRYLKLWGDVRLTRFEEVLDAPVLDYDAATRVMVFPEGGHLEGPTVSGTATLLTWDLGSNTLIGENGVTVIIKPRPAAPVAPEQEQDKTSSAVQTPQPKNTVAPTNASRTGASRPAVAQPKTTVTQPKLKAPSTKTSPRAKATSSKKTKANQSKSTPQTPASRKKPSSAPTGAKS